MQEDIINFGRWCEINQLKINVEKTNVMTIANKHIFDTEYFLNGLKLENVIEMRDLGVIVDSKLKFESQLNSVKNKASKPLN